MKPGTGALTMGHMAIGKPKPRSDSVLKDAPREGFTAHASKFFDAQSFDEICEADAKLLVARMDFTAAMAAIREGKQNAAVRRSVLVNRN